MADLPVDYAPTVKQTVGGFTARPMAPQTPERALPRYANPGPDAFGAAVGRGQEALGRGEEQAGGDILRVGKFFNSAAADAASNDFEEKVTHILYGAPGAVGPDGQPDTGYFGKKGRDALDARAGVMQNINDLMRKTQGTLPALESQERFSEISRRFRTITDGKVGEFASRQSTIWQTEVNSASAKLAIDGISRSADNEQDFMDQTANLISARVKQAQLNGGGPELMKQAMDGAKQEALEARLNIISTKDPARAMRMLEANKDTAGAKYDNLYARFNARAQQQIGQDYAGRVVGPQLPLENGEDTKEVIKHFEGFISTPKMDTDGKLRVGYGSDTVTKADGSVERVTADSRVTQADAERDLDRRATEFQNKARNAVGKEAWDGLSPKAKASLTSITYNYGTLPQSVADAAKTGDPKAIGAAIMGLQGHNGGINANRRAQEAANVTGEVGPDVDHAAVLRNIENSDLDPLAKAAATAKANHLFAMQRNAKVTDKAQFETSVKNSEAEAMQTGGTSNPVPQEIFEKHYGTNEGRVRYLQYQSNLEFGAVKQGFENLSDNAIQQVINDKMPKPGDPDYAHKVANLDRLRKYADALDKQRREDPAGAVDRMEAVKQAKGLYDPKKPDSFKPTIQARIAAQDALDLPNSAISENEAKGFAAQLKPVARDGVDAATQTETINNVVDQVRQKYGDEYADQAMGRILYHVTLKKDAADVLAAAVTRAAKPGADPAPTAEEAKRLQISRDAERAAAIAGERQAAATAQYGSPTRPEIGPDEPGGAGAAALMPPIANPATVKQAVTTASQAPRKPFSGAVDTLRSDPAKYMPFFIQKFGIKSVPPDLQGYLPRPEAEDH